MTDFFPENFYDQRTSVRQIFSHIGNIVYHLIIKFFDFLCKMSIEQYFKKISNEDMDEIDDNESSVMDSDLEETHTNINKQKTQKNLNFKKKKARLLTKKKTEGFQKEWLEIYKWLIYDSSKNLMFCSLCKSHKKLNKFGKEGNIIFFILKIFYLIYNYINNINN